MLNAFSMNNHLPIMDIARAAGVSKTTVSLVLSGKGDRNRIARATQERIRTVARQMNYQSDTGIGAADSATPAPVAIPSATRPASREIALVLAMTTPATSLALVPGLGLALGSAGFNVTLVTLPPDPAAAHDGIARLSQSGAAGFLCCPTVYSTLSAQVPGRPVIALSPWAAESLIAGMNPTVTPSRQPEQPATPSPPLPTPPPLAPVIATTTASPTMTQPTPVIEPATPSDTMVEPTPQPVAEQVVVPPLPTPEPVCPTTEESATVSPVAPEPATVIESAPAPDTVTEPTPEPIAEPILPTPQSH